MVCAAPAEPTLDAGGVPERRTVQIAQRALAPALPARAWRVDVDPGRTRWSCAVPGCSGAALKGRRAPQVALGHLAEHAAAEPLPRHLRTCRCHSHGCAWHPRHRGCDGPVSLVVFRSRGGATWQLADACTACARSIPYAAQLPSAPPRTPQTRRLGARVATDPVGCPDDAAADDLEALLTYLDAALAAGTEAQVRLLALLCLLRANRDGEIRLPHGLLRGWRLADRARQHLDELVRQRWLCEQPGVGEAASPVRIRDNAGLAVLRSSDRRHRGRLLDQAVRLLRQPTVRGALAPDRLTALWVGTTGSQLVARSAHPFPVTGDRT